MYVYVCVRARSRKSGKWKRKIFKRNKLAHIVTRDASDSELLLENYVRE